MTRKNNKQTPAQIEQLTPQQAQVINLLVAGKTQTETAQEVGIAHETISRWKINNASFIAAYNEAKQNQWDVAAAGLDALATQALTTLGELMTDEDPRIKLQAVKLWLDHRQDRPTGSADPKNVKNSLIIDNMFDFPLP